MLERIPVVIAHVKANKTVLFSISCALCASNNDKAYKEKYSVYKGKYCIEILNMLRITSSTI